MQKGESDRLTADRIVQSPGPYDTACFHAQQAVEKYLKAVLALAGSRIPRTHDLEDIYDLCLAVMPGLVLDREELSALTPYAVELQYDMEFWPDPPRVQQALATVDRVRTAVLAVLPPAAHP
jgi:HEPN domain-containing protein